jgi:hypothetical protein
VLIMMFLVFAAAIGMAYAYTRREMSPYAPSMHDYLDSNSTDTHDSTYEDTARAA